MASKRRRMAFDARKRRRRRRDRKVIALREAARTKLEKAMAKEDTHAGTS